MHHHVRRTVTFVIKLALAAAILVWLVVQARDGFAKLAERTLSWPFLGAALACSLATATLSFVRWHILIRALGIEIRLNESLRLGALGFALNFVSPGSIGGDFFKAVFLAHGQPGRRTEAVATVIADRILGLLTMLAIASCGIVATGLNHAESISLQVLCRTILISAIVGWSVFGVLIVFGGMFGNRVIGRVARLPVVGHTLQRLLGTVRVYRGRKPMLLAAFVASAMMAACFITTFWLVARGLPIHAPSWSEHVVIVPVAGLVGALPLTPSGLGTMEFAVEELYKLMPDATVSPGDGTLVALGRRVTDIVVALAGLAFYLTHRREVEEVFAEAEECADVE
ncbi:MAG: flippase-like domain-containing protein [Pirellulales bacterium]|nr:flippase-like domain-containing protein [Pirellulales bacterium]